MSFVSFANVIGNSNRGGGGDGPTFSTEYQAILDYSTTQVFTAPSIGFKVKGDTLITDLKAAGIWSILDVFYVFYGDGDSDFAKINWKNPGTFQATEIGTPTYTASQGFKGNGSSDALDTGWTPLTSGSNFTQDSASFAIDIANNTISGGRCGTADASGNNTLTIIPISGANRAYAVNISSIRSSAGNVTGFIQSNRSAVTASSLWVDGVSVDSYGGISTSRSSSTLRLLCNNSAGTSNSFMDANIYMASLGASMTGKEMAFYTAWNTYRS